MNYKDVAKRICDFYEQECLSQVHGLDRYLGYAGMFLANKQIESAFEKIKNNSAIKMFDIIKDDNIDIDKLHLAFKYAIEKTNTVELFGMKLNNVGIETLFKYLKD